MHKIGKDNQQDFTLGEILSDGWIVFADKDGNQQRSPGEALLAYAPPPELLPGSAEFAGTLSYTADGRTHGTGAATGSGSFVFCAAGTELAARVVLLPGNGLPVRPDPGHEAALPACPGDPQR
ncbi:MAG: GspH/FimT family protein [Gammaproteobacteria bacterium]|nr:GspH/FimT family protein [Gammaproteobacteria bacterium]